MKTSFFLLLSLVLVGAGCTTAVSPVDTDDVADDVVVEVDNAMVVQGEEVSDLVVEEDETKEATEKIEDDQVNSKEDNESTTSEEAPDAVVFNLDAFSFGYSSKELRVKKDQTVTINLTSTGGLHDWVVDEFGAATEKVSTGGVTNVTFVADKAGTFEYYCSIGQHRANGMVGTLVVE